MTNAFSSPQEPFPVSTPVDILAFIPHTLGFVPQESLVLMTMDHSRLGATLRLDLPAAAPDYSEFASRVTELLRTDGAANGVLMALYTDRKWKQRDAPPCLRLVAELGRTLAEAGLPIRDGWLVSRHAWREYFCTDSTCCPWPGHSLGMIADSTLSAEMVYRGSAYAQSLTEAVDLDLPPAWESGGEAARHRVAYGRRLRGRWCRRSQFAGTLAVWDDLITGMTVPVLPGTPGLGRAATPHGLTETAGPPGAADTADPLDFAGPQEPGRGCPRLRSDPELAGFLLASLHARPVRDTLLVMAALGCAKALDGADACHLLSRDERPPLLPPGTDGTVTVPASGRTGEPAGPGPASDPGEVFREVLIGRYAGIPDWAGMDAAFAVFAELLAAATANGAAGPDREANTGTTTGTTTSTSAPGTEADGEAAAALLSLLAWIEWARGRGSRAQSYLSRCLDLYPEYRLAELLGELLASGLFPVWARNAGTAWRPVPERHPGAARS